MENKSTDEKRKTNKRNNMKKCPQPAKCIMSSRQRVQAVREQDVYFSGPEFESLPLSLAGFVLGKPEFKSSATIVK